MKIIHVVGARPNFMKVSPVMSALNERDNISQILVHTGQHYDDNMSEVFFRQLNIPRPDMNLGVGSDSQTRQTARIMLQFEEVLQENKPDLALVYGDVNSTIAAALVCAKLLIPVGHVEAGLRSFDRSMPEEINRLLTDQIADLLFTPSADGDENLLREGIPQEKIFRVGNVMIDTLIRMLDAARKCDPFTKLKWEKPQKFALVTLHRPSNVDNPAQFGDIMSALDEISNKLPVVFPIHPRTRKMLSGMNYRADESKMHLIEPIDYVDFVALQMKAAAVITDSGGIQEETTYLGVPCLTIRENTERPITVDVGTNILVGGDMAKLKSEIENILNGGGKSGRIPELWDGHASERIADVILSKFTV